MTRSRGARQDDLEEGPGSAEIPPAVLLDVAPPFVYLDGPDYREFQAKAHRYGVIRQSLDPALRRAFFFASSDKVDHCFLAPRGALEAAQGELDAYMSTGFLEDRFPPHLVESELLTDIRYACDLRRVSIGADAAHLMPADADLRGHIDDVLAATHARHLVSGAPLSRLLKSISNAARTFIPTTGTREGAGRATKSASTGLREPRLAADEAAALRLLRDGELPQGALVFGLEGRSGREPVAFLPVEFARLKDGFAVKLPPRPSAFILESRPLADNAEGADVSTFIVDLDLPSITPWADAYAVAVRRIAAALCEVLGRAPCPLGDITFMGEGRQKALVCWLEAEEAGLWSSSLKKIDQLAVHPDPVAGAPGLLPLARQTEGEPPAKAPELDRAARIAHSDPKHPLDPFQARAAAGVASLQGVWAQSVTGPPGTGKTSMMRDVISDRIARSLLDDKPPAILLAGPTIQAYENLLDAVSFSWTNPPSGAERPFPDIPHIGAIIPTATSLKKAAPRGTIPHLRYYSARQVVSTHPGYTQVLLPAQSGKVVADDETAGILRILIDEDQPLPLSEIEASALSANATARLEASRAVIEGAHRLAALGDDRQLAQMVLPPEIADWEEPLRKALESASSANLSDALDGALDVTLRLDAFHTTFRLTQLRFILSAYEFRRRQAALRLMKAVRKTDRDDLLQAFKDTIAYLLPIRTATVTSLGGKAREQFGRPADMVVIDEAGMMEPCFVPAMMAEGERTLAVGDPYQIPPVGTDALPIYGAQMLRAGLDDDMVSMWSMPELPPRGMEPPRKAGNGLSIIETMSPFAEQGGLVLRRHYRCPASIIEISNALVYRPRGIALEAVKPDPAPNPEQLPVIATVLHDGEPPDRSNFNPQEAEAIATAFLLHLRSILATAKGAPPAAEITLENNLELMANAVAFVSPYRQQAKLERFGPHEASRRQRFARLYQPYLPKGADVLYEGYLPNLMLARLREFIPGQDDRVRKAIEATVFGTIHALQGAEKPVVFLSCVAAERTQFFNKDPSLINVGVTRSQSHLVIARSTAFAKDDPEGTPARNIADAVARSGVILPERLVLVESDYKRRPIEQALGPAVKVIASRGSIARVVSLDEAGDPVVALESSTPQTAAQLDLARSWITPVDEGGFGLKSLVLGTDADDAGETIAHDLVSFLGLDREEIVRRGLSVTRWPMEDPAALGSYLAEDIAAARSFNPEVTGLWRARRQRARAELRTALSRGLRAELRRRAPESDEVRLGALRTMRWLHDRETSGWEVCGEIADEDDRRFNAPLCASPGLVRTFDTHEEAQACARTIMETPELTRSQRAIPSPVRTRRSLFDVLSVLSLGGVAPLAAMRALQAMFERTGRDDL